jgi:hypothetical protein
MTALEFARTYNIEEDFVIMEYICQLLLGQEDSHSYKARIAGVLEDVANQEKLVQILIESILPQISPYDYERLMFIFSQVKRLEEGNDIAKRGTMVLDVLSSYTRVSAPTFDELVLAKEGNVTITTVVGASVR